MSKYADSSSVLMYGNVIDARRLTLAAEYFELECSKMSDLSQEFSQWLLDFFGEDFISLWKINGRAAASRSLLEKLEPAAKSASGLLVQAEAFLKSQLVYDKRSCRRISSCMQKGVLSDYPKSANRLQNGKYMGALWHEGEQNPFWRFSTQIGGYKEYIPWNGKDNIEGSHSADYLLFWKELFSDRPVSSDEICRRIYRIFSEKKRYYQNPVFGQDVQAFFHTRRYQNIKDLCYGHFQVSIHSYCAGTHRRDVAELFLRFAEHISVKYGNINARIMLQPGSTSSGESPYMTYFGSNRLGDGSCLETGQLPEEWYRTYYMRGVEWGNILSSRVMKHLPNLKEGVDGTKEILVKKLKNGAFMLRSEKDIDAFDVDDALKLKEIAADALYPGGTTFALSRILPREGKLPFLLRKDWAIIPVFESEIEVVAKDLVFRACSR